MCPINIVISLHIDEDVTPVLVVTCKNALQYNKINKHLTNINIEYTINGINKYYSIAFVAIEDVDYVINNIVFEI